jgi:hypothetical protein
MNIFESKPTWPALLAVLVVAMPVRAQPPQPFPPGVVGTIGLDGTIDKFG